MSIINNDIPKSTSGTANLLRKLAFIETDCAQKDTTIQNLRQTLAINKEMLQGLLME